ncbi:MAG: hypothetical protein KC451_14260 [Amylibacter sp.]|jgi:hypothetical protein|nr:hypothetical protein [Amylibacter sp.]
MKRHLILILLGVVTIFVIIVAITTEINITQTQREAYEDAEISNIFEERFQNKIVPSFWGAPNGFEAALTSIDARNLLARSVPNTDLREADVLFIFVKNEQGLQEFPYYDLFSMDEIKTVTSTKDTLSIKYDLQIDSELGVKKFRLQIFYFDGRKGDAIKLSNTVCLARYLYGEAIFENGVHGIPRYDECKKD